MEAPPERRFRPPPEFEAWSPAPPPGLCRQALAPPRAELWLIRTPPDFRPQSLDGCAVPLGGAGRLRGGLAAGGAPGRGGSARLLVPDGPGGALVCAPPLRGAVAIRCVPGDPDVPGIPERPGDPGVPEYPGVPTDPGVAADPEHPGAPPEHKAKRKKKKKKEREKEPEVPAVGTPVRTEPHGEWECRPPRNSQPAPMDTEELPELPRKKRKHKREREPVEMPVGTELPCAGEQIPA